MRRKLRKLAIYVTLIIAPLLTFLVWCEAETIIENFRNLKRAAREVLHMTAVQDSVFVEDVRPYYNILALIEKQKELEPRRVYPYSVVEGGAHSVEELRSAIWRDPVVAKHYSGFKLDRARLVENRTARYFHVSYRKNGEIFWTKKKLKIAKGEILVTDGSNIARTRCANLLAEFPRGRTSPDEPPPEVFDSPEYPPWSPPSEPPPSQFLVRGPVDPKFSVPEPGTMLLIVTGMLGVAGLARKKS